MENFAQTLTHYLEPAKGKSRDEFIKTFAYSVLVEKSGMVSLDNPSLPSSTEIRNDIGDVPHPLLIPVSQLTTTPRSLNSARG